MSVSPQPIIESICYRFAQLDANSRQEVLERIRKLDNEHKVSSPELDVEPPDAERRVRISDLWGVGAEMWREAGGADEYIRKERESWEGCQN